MNLWNINVIHGLKTAIASVLAYVITIVLNLEFGYWAVLSTVIVMQYSGPQSQDRIFPILRVSFG